MGLIVGSGMSQISQDRQSPYSSRHIYRAMPIKFSVKVRGMVLKKQNSGGGNILVMGNDRNRSSLSRHL